MFQKIKTRIKQAKIAWILIAIIFLAMIVSNIYLLVKVDTLENKVTILSGNNNIDIEILK